MSNSDKVADLLILGEAYLTDLINRNNRTSFAPEDLVFGLPTSSADEVYNTDIEVTFPVEPTSTDPTPDPVTGDLHYQRFDLGRLFSNRSIQLRDSEDYLTTRDLRTALLGEARINLEAADIVDTAIPAGSPKRVIIVADPNSLRFFGKFSLDLVEPIEPDTSFITAPEITANTTPAPMGMKYDNTLFFETGHQSGAMLKSSNQEIEVAGAVRIRDYNGVFNSTDSTYRVNVADNADWTIPFSFALTDKRNADHITDIYTCTVKITASQGGGYLNFELRRLYGQLVLVDDENELFLYDPACYNQSQTLFQNIVRVMMFKHKLGSLTCNAIGAPYGTFTVELKAVRKTNDEPPVIVTYTAIVDGLAP